MGYYFDRDGFNEHGGYYDPNTGLYVSPGEDDYDLMENYYEETIKACGGSDDEDEDPEEEVEDAEEIAAIRQEHCLPVLKWLREQP